MLIVNNDERSGHKIEISMSLLHFCFSNQDESSKSIPSSITSNMLYVSF